MNIIMTVRIPRPCTSTMKLVHVSLGLLLIGIGTITAAPQVQHCAVTVGNTDALCADLLRWVTPLALGTPQDCDCFSFCNDNLIQCSRFGEVKPFQCVGNTVAGCRRMEQSNMASLPTDTGSDNDQACAVTVNANDQICGTLLLDNIHKAPDQTTPCDCYNFCNGKLIGCLDFGQRVTFSCSGDVVAGCLESQRQFGTTSSGITIPQSFVVTALIMVGTTVVML
jgi:hypothetical protein